MTAPALNPADAAPVPSRGGWLDLSWKRVRIVARSDLRQLIEDKGFWMPMVFLGAIFFMIIPTVLLLTITKIGDVKVVSQVSETLKVLLGPMAANAIEPVGAMGNDTPLAVLSDQPQLLYNYFKQLFAQVTNPPIDAIREELVTATEVMMGTEGNLLDSTPLHCRQIKLKTPILTNAELAKFRQIDVPGFRALTLSILFRVDEGVEGLKRGLEELYTKASKAIDDGYNILILSDRGISANDAPIPALLATSGLIAGLAFYLAGQADMASLIWVAGAIPALAALVIEILRSSGRGEVGLDIVAALSMSAVLVFGETLAAAVWR